MFTFSWHYSYPSHADKELSSPISRVVAPSATLNSEGGTHSSSPSTDPLHDTGGRDSILHDDETGHHQTGNNSASTSFPFGVTNNSVLHSSDGGSTVYSSSNLVTSHEGFDALEGCVTVENDTQNFESDEESDRFASLDEEDYETGSHWSTELHADLHVRMQSGETQTLNIQDSSYSPDSDDTEVRCRCRRINMEECNGLTSCDSISAYHPYAQESQSS